MILPTLPLLIKISFGKILYILLHIEVKGYEKKWQKNLNSIEIQFKDIIKKIRDYLLENNVNPTFNGEIENGRTLHNCR